MLKNIIKGIAIGGAAVAMLVSSASADALQINLYGASAQFTFWTSAAPKYLADGVNGYGCTGGVYHAVNYLEADGCDRTDDDTADDWLCDLTNQDVIAPNQNRDTGIAVCNGDTAITGVSEIDGLGTKDTLVITYTTNASYDGLFAVQDIATEYNPDSTACTTLGQRLLPVLDSNTILYDYSVHTSAKTSIPTLACQDVNIGASDVAATTFGQKSTGYAKGPNGGDEVIRDIKDVPTPFSGTFTEARPIVVPFAFFANDDASTPVPFDNMTRPMAVNLFSGKIANWGQFWGPADETTGDYSQNDMQVTICLRHAGSGTHATLDAAVMRGDAALPTKEKSLADDFTGEENPFTHELPSFDPTGGVAAGILPYIFFNKGSSDELKCVGHTVGAVGYADVDKCGGVDNENCDEDTDSLGKAKLMTYNGELGLADAIKYGRYDFWSAQYLYYKTADTNAMLISNLIAYASDSANMPSKKQPYWASQDDMVWSKTSDFFLPTLK